MRLVLFRRIARRRWSPVSLYWRRARKARLRPTAPRPAAPAAVFHTWLSHGHLHFSERGSSLPLSKAAAQPPHSKVQPRLAAAAVTRELRRSVVSRHVATTRVVAASTPSRAALRAPRVFPARSTAVAKIHVPQAAHGSSPQVRASIVHRTRETMRVSASSRETARVKRTIIASNELRVFHRHSTTRVDATTHELSRREREIHHPPELQFRTAPRPSVIPSAVEGSPSAGDPSTAPGMTRAAHETAPPVVRRAERAPLRAADLDPTLLDRLTDDVIRRVEKRVRIERERRGL